MSYIQYDMYIKGVELLSLSQGLTGHKVLYLSSIRLGRISGAGNPVFNRISRHFISSIRPEIKFRIGWILCVWRCTNVGYPVAGCAANSSIRSIPSLSQACAPFTFVQNQFFNLKVMPATYPTATLCNRTFSQEENSFL